jgi:predicted PhzF superfamily epimerase YddE/YHI9
MSTTPVSAHVIRYSAFTDHPGGGNPAGIVLDAISLDEERMLGAAREVGYSEPAFLRPHLTQLVSTTFAISALRRRCRSAATRPLPLASR